MTVHPVHVYHHYQHPQDITWTAFILALLIASGVMCLAVWWLSR